MTTILEDTISRQAAIDEIQQMSPKLFSGSHYHNAYVDKLEVMIRLMALPPAQQWTPVTEGLPKEKGPYLVSGNSEVWVCEFIQIGTTKGWSNPISRPVVKAWMPLPESYKEKRQ